MTAAAPARQPDGARFPALDGLRAVAVLAVVGTHAAFWTGRYERGPASGLLARLDVGVAIFFALSGFLLGRPWLIAAASGAERPLWRVYAWRRVLRILPAYWVTVVAAMVLLPENQSASAADWLHQLTLVQIYQISWFRPGLTQTWSLCTEVAFYLLLPLLGELVVRACHKHQWRPRVLLCGCAALGAASVGWILLISATGWALTTAAVFWLPGFLVWFAAGMALAVVHVDVERHPQRWPRFRSAASSAGSCWLLALAALAVAATPVGGAKSIGLTAAGTGITKALIYTLIAGLLIAPCVFGAARLPQLVLANPVVRWVGVVSYSIFLTHLIVLDWVMRLLGYQLFTGSATQVFLATLAGTLVISAALYRVVEVPALRLRRLVPDVRRTPAMLSPSVPAP
jgi:peptidoglycan/LPS O-acetylase OafA/YrhL